MVSPRRLRDGVAVSIVVRVVPLRRVDGYVDGTSEGFTVGVSEGNVDGVSDGKVEGDVGSIRNPLGGISMSNKSIPNISKLCIISKRFSLDSIILMGNIQEIILCIHSSQKRKEKKNT